MYVEGNIIFFTPFFFKNKNTAKSKFFVVLKVIDNQLILGSLPTSKDYIPSNDVIASGCLELTEINLNCFVISPNEPITVCNKHLRLTTYIYGHELDTYELSKLQETYRIEGSDYTVFGAMKPEIFSSLIQCLKKSNSVKKKYIKVLT